METILALHLRLSNTVWLFFLLLGLWGLFRAFRGQGVDGNYLGAMVIGQALYIIQGILGAILWGGGLLSGLQRPSIHILYGVFALVFLPFIYFVWLRGDDSNRAQWSLAFAILFLFGIALRAISTGV
jgi:hypothetical protein